jgi:hypothetical protein
MASDLAAYANRMAPGLAGSSPPKITFATGANAEVQLRTAAGAARYYSIKVVGSAGASCNVATGMTGLAAPTANDPLFEIADGWQDMVLNSARHTSACSAEQQAALCSSGIGGPDGVQRRSDPEVSAVWRRLDSTVGCAAPRLHQRDRCHVAVVCGNDGRNVPANRWVLHVDQRH